MPTCIKDLLKTMQIDKQTNGTEQCPETVTSYTEIEHMTHVMRISRKGYELQ